MRQRFNYAKVAAGCAYCLDVWNRLSIFARLAPGGYQPTAAAS